MADGQGSGFRRPENETSGSYKQSLWRLEDGVAVLSMNRPEKHNAGAQGIGELMDWAYGAPEVRCILLRGEGPSFNSGRDTSQLGKRPEGVSDFSFVRHSQEGVFRMMDTAKPIVAAIQGYAIGGGFEMALRADIRVAADDACFFLPEIKYGILPDTGGTQILTTLIGPSKTKYLVMTGDRIDAKTALEWGVVDWVVPRAELEKKAFEVAHKLAAGPPLAVAMAKQLVDQVWAGTVRSGIRQELLAQSYLFKTDDYQETRAALREDRPPVYKGK